MPGQILAARRKENALQKIEQLKTDLIGVNEDEEKEEQKKEQDAKNKTKKEKRSLSATKRDQKI